MSGKTSVACGECGSSCDLVFGKDVYPHRKDLYGFRFWRCPKCGAYCGCHGNTDRALGSPCGPQTRAARKAAHAAFDPLWKGLGNERRSQVYRWLATVLGIPVEKCHIAMMDTATARRVVEACRETKAGAK